MIKYAVVQIGSRQYLVEPNKPFLVDYQGEIKELICEKVLLISDGKEVEVGKPFLEDKISFTLVETIKQPKIRVATYKAKANTRRVKGIRPLKSKLQFAT